MPLAVDADHTVALPTAGFKADGAAIAPDIAPPRLGAHTREVLQEAGLAPAEIDALRRAGVVACDPEADRLGATG